MKYILIIPDGLGDNPLKELGGKTPLEAASTPHMDYFASRGRTGTSRNIPDGFVPGTDIGCMSVFGYDPAKYFTGRGPLEAAELGIDLEPGDLAFRCNLVTLESGNLKDFSADHISTGEARALLDFLNKKLKKTFSDKVRFYPGKGTGYRNLMIYKGDDGSMQKTACTPPHDIMGRRYADFLPDGPGAGFLRELMSESAKVFKNHAVNRKRAHDGKGEASMIWLWGQGSSPALPSYFERYGIHGSVITAVDLVKGIAIHAGLDVIKVPGVTGFFDTNYSGKADYAVRSLKSHDFAAIHVESTDEGGHMGDAKLKIQAIEDVDRYVLGTLREHLEEFESYKVMLLPDHYTCVETRTHANTPVPFFIYSSAETQKGPSKFCEKTAGASGWRVEAGHTLMDEFIGPAPGGGVSHA